LFHVENGWTDGQTNMTNLTVALRNFANTPKNARKNTHSKKRRPQVSESLWRANYNKL